MHFGIFRGLTASCSNSRCFRHSSSGTTSSVRCCEDCCAKRLWYKLVTMGASSSTPRTVTIDNDSPAGVIDISDDVVKRLKTGMPPKEGAVSQQSHGSSPGDGHVPSSYPNPLPPPSAGYGEPTLTSMQVRREKEQELRANDVYWTKRLHGLEANLQKTNQILEKEYNDAIVDVKKRFDSTAVTHQLPPCQDLKAKVIECYKKNQHETLKCSADVTAFTDCVNLHRIQLLQEKASVSTKPAGGK